MSKPKKREKPKLLSQAELGDIVRTTAGVLRIGWKPDGILLPTVSLCDPDTLKELGRPFHIRCDLPVLQVLRDQSHFAGGVQGGGEIDPLKGG